MFLARRLFQVHRKELVGTKPRDHLSFLELDWLFSKNSQISIGRGRFVSGIEIINSTPSRIF